jgi:hypothetical protein
VKVRAKPERNQGIGGKDGMGTYTNNVETNPDYWDCECEGNYIHRKTDVQECVICETSQDDQPDSMVAEVDEVQS